ncbi:hypothetical protein [Xanthomonas phage SB4]|uniref:Uncharacterized protein n=1 Tax=Xanthomonas phage SB4 TaxID=3117473 RepID=A0ABZ2GUT1_9CAUD
MANIVPLGTGAAVSEDIVATENVPITLSYFGESGGSLIIERLASDGKYYQISGPYLSVINSPLNFRGNSTIRVRRVAGTASCGCDRD